jgi:hypothetical protein
MRRATFTVFAIALLSCACIAQSWSEAYDKGLAKARAGDWTGAREAFKQAAAFRPEDVSGATLLPGPATDKKRWRDGAPYSPNFLAAYCTYRLANETRDPQERAQLLKTAGAELAALVAKDQVSYEALYYLNAVYTQTGDVQKQRELEARIQALTSQLQWKVDTEVVAPEELAQIAALSGRDVSVTTVTPETIAAGGQPPPTAGTTSPNVIEAPRVGVRVPVIATKYALIIGNSESRLPEGPIAHAADDAQLIREALVSNAGYAEENIEVVINATSAQLMATAKALSERVPDNATVLIFFAGNGINVDGKDYLAGVDTESAGDTASMSAKASLYKLFMDRGSKIFAFFESNRSVVNGRFFGSEVPMFGMIAQGQATIPGQQVYSLVRNGKTVGAYADAFSAVLAQFRTNRVPITEFGWQVFYRIRRGDTGTVDGSSRQTPTLPVRTNLAADARF